MAVTYPAGFRAAALKAGIKPSGKIDLALIVRDAKSPRDRSGCAMVFTQNRLIGAPIVIGRDLRSRTLKGEIVPSAVLINAGNSNSATGDQGVKDAKACCEAVARQLGLGSEDVVPSSTGVIGRLLPVEKITSRAAELVTCLASGEAADASAAEAIMTTDLVPKVARREIRLSGGTVRIGAIAKGSGMIAPRLDSAYAPLSPSATMLAFITTDAPIDSVLLQHALDAVAGVSFNCISVDNHASCSDTVVCMSSGQATGVDPLKAGSSELAVFTDALRSLCMDLAMQVVTDGEGATRIFTVRVSGTRNDLEASTIAREVVNSPLVKCAIHGQDPNWGRIVTAAGNAGVDFDINATSLSLGPVVVFEMGRPLPEALTDPRLKPTLAAKALIAELRVGSGPGRGHMIGCDLSAQYVRINADYTT